MKKIWIFLVFIFMLSIDIWGQNNDKGWVALKATLETPEFFFNSGKDYSSVTLTDNSEVQRARQLEAGNAFIEKKENDEKRLDEAEKKANAEYEAREYANKNFHKKRSALSLLSPQNIDKSSPGKVVVTIEIDNSGNVIDAEILESSTSKSNEDAAIIAAKKSKFSSGSGNIKQTLTYNF